MENNDSLTVIAEARAAVADRLVTPWWYHPALGLLLAGYVLGFSLGNTAVRLAVCVLFAAACLGLARIYRRITGVWVSGFDAGRAGRWAKALGALTGITALTGWGLTYWTHQTWPAWLLATAAFAAAVVLGRRFDSALRAQLRAGA